MAPALRIALMGTTMRQSASELSRQEKRWLVIVSRNQSDLYAHLVQAFSRDTKVRVILDRRRDDSRTPPEIAHRLRTHGAVIIRQA
jgi:hypothetical protein